jgi:hypothetical protein
VFGHRLESVRLQLRFALVAKAMVQEIERVMTMTPPNPPAAPNPAIASLLVIVAHRRGVGELERWAAI